MQRIISLRQLERRTINKTRVANILGIKSEDVNILVKNGLLKPLPYPISKGDHLKFAINAIEKLLDQESSLVNQEKDEAKRIERILIERAQQQRN